MRERPNILWIVTTQWRAQACGYAGDPNAQTPALDAFAATAVNYAEAVTPHPFGPFARAALLTGVPSPENGVRDYFDPLPTSARTIAHDLRDRGYATAWFGKWHLAPRDSTAPLVGEAHARTIVPAERRGGFDFWEGFEGGFLLNDPWLHGTRLSEPERQHGYQPDVVAASADRWWRERAGDARPWFAVVSVENPHPPYDAPPADLLAPDPASLVLADNVPRGGDIEARARRELAGYYAHIRATDTSIGRLFQAVERPAAAERRETVIVFTSVHGDMHGAYGLFRKGWPHEESIRVPFLVRHPGLAPRPSEEPVSLLDLPAMTRAWADGTGWSCPREFAVISMPSVVALPDQCDCRWHGIRALRRKAVFRENGECWFAGDPRRETGEGVATDIDAAWLQEAREQVEQDRSRPA